jgi:GT2 family glycosyltransferase
MSSTPPLSVILIHHSGSAHLAACLESIEIQRHVRPELVVVDRSGDADAAAELTRQRPRFAALLTDAILGPVDSLNRGLAHARGEWVLFLRSDDRLVGDMILSESLNWMRKTEAGVVVGEAACSDGHIAKFTSHPNALRGEFVPPSAAFYRRSLFEENGDFDPAFPQLAVYDFTLRLWKSRIRFKPIPLRVVAGEYRLTPSLALAREEIAVRHRHFSRGRSFASDVRSLLRGMLG